MSRKPAPFAWRGVTTQLLALVVLPLSVLAVVIAFGGLSLHRQAMRMMVGERDERAARAAATAISEQLNHRTKAIQGLALLVREVEAPDTALALLTDAGYLHEDFEYGLALARRGAGLLAQHGGEGFWASLDFEAPVLQQAMNRDLPPAFVVLAHPLTGDPVVLALATAAKGGPIALGAFDPAALARNVLAGIFVSDAGGAVYLVAPDGQTLYRSGLSADFENGEAHPGIREALAGNSGTEDPPGITAFRFFQPPRTPPQW